VAKDTAWHGMAWHGMVWCMERKAKQKARELNLFATIIADDNYRKLQKLCLFLWVLFFRRKGRHIAKLCGE
jgi:hypothetical protein